MASESVTQGVANTIAEDLISATSPIYQVDALLRGALALMEGRVFEDPEIFAALEILEMAQPLASRVFMNVDDLRIVERIRAIEGQHHG